LTAAGALRNAGREAVVFERMGELQEVGAGLTLSPNAVTALRSIGLGEAVESAGAELGWIEHRTAEGKILSRWPTGESSRKLGAPIVGLSRPQLQDVLAQGLGDVELRTGMELTSFEQDAEGVTVRFADGSEERGVALIGADGRDSTVRRHVDSTGLRYLGYTTWRAVVHHERVAPGVHVQSYGRGSLFGIIPLADGLVYWYGSENTPAGGSDPEGEARKAALLSRFEGWHDPIEELIDASETAGIARADIFDLPERKRWGEGRVTLLGDAAHPTAPTLGQGACQAIEDGVVLARCLRENGAVAAGLRAYERARIDRTNWIVRQSRTQGKLTQFEHPLGCLIRNTTLRLLPKRMVLRELEKTATFEP
jgi:2-polyprenyl-6-methoxyphenol hydroxylase-like FAD-dependent oxidoreductase